MFQRHEYALAGVGGPATPAFGRTARLAPPAPAQPFLRRSPRFGLAVDLGRDLFTLAWWRGLATCLALCAVHVVLAPPLATLPGPVPAPLSPAQWEQSRALGFAPLAYGADTGHRMAPTSRAEPLADVPERPRVDLLAVLGRGEGFARVLQRAGVSVHDALTAESLLARHADLRSVRAGTPVELTLGARPAPGAPRPLERLSFRARLDLRLALHRSGGALSVVTQPVAVDDTPLRITGRVGPSLYHAARAAGAPPRAVAAFLRALSAHANVGGLSPDDRFDLVLANRRVVGGSGAGESEPGELLYAGLDRADGRDLKLLRWVRGGRAQFFEASGVGRTQGAMHQPVAGFVTSHFGWRRHPILGFGRMHRGMDFGARHGSPVYAATDGRVTFAGRAGGYGNQVRVDHGGGMVTTYSHLSALAAGPGGAVRGGQIIGYVGSTGFSTGPHLHYELHRNGVAVDPRSVRFVSRSALEGTELAVFRAKLASLLSLPTSAPR